MERIVWLIVQKSSNGKDWQVIEKGNNILLFPHTRKKLAEIIIKSMNKDITKKTVYLRKGFLKF